MRNYLISLISLLTVSFVYAKDCQKEIPSKRIIKPIDSEIPIEEKASEKRVVKKEKLEVKKKSTPKKLFNNPFDQLKDINAK